MKVENELLGGGRGEIGDEGEVQGRKVNPNKALWKRYNETYRIETSKQTNMQNRSLSYLLNIKILWSYFMITGLESQW